MAQNLAANAMEYAEHCRCMSLSIMIMSLFGLRSAGFVKNLSSKQAKNRLSPEREFSLAPMKMVIGNSILTK
jgi:hypothetical protein